MSSFYMVRKIGTDLFYNPNIPGDRVNPTFHKEGKRYYGPRGLVNAQRAVKFCLLDHNPNWRPIEKKQPVHTCIQEFVETVKFVRTL